MQTNSALIGLGIVGLLRISSIIRVAKDSAQRTSSVGLHTMYILLVTLLTPLLGLPLYLLVRPSAYQKDRMPRRESIVMNNIPCHTCGMLNLLGHHFCVFCGDAITVDCKECNQRYPHHYDYCFHCGCPHIHEVNA